MPSLPQVRVLPSKQDLFRAAAEQFFKIGRHAIEQSGRFTVALSGGSTPRGLHAELVANYASKLPWNKVFFFWGDERHVPPDFPESNFRMADETLLSRISVPAANIWRMRGELPDADQAAREYEAGLRSFFGSDQGFPAFDFILLGIGGDGHTASLFPGTKALEERERWVVGNWVEQHSTFRITFTYPVLNQASYVMFLVEGAGKAEIVHRALRDANANLPCQKVKPAGELAWYLDQAAAAKL